MPGLVEQLQLEALDPTVPVSQLLRRVKVVAVKLKLPLIAEWVDQELTGYKDEPPAYRHLRGQPKVLNPYRGWMPIGGDADLVEALSVRSITQPISSLEDLVGRPSDEGGHMVPYPQRTINALNKGQELQFQEMALHIDRSTIVSLIDQVRGRILDWALDLEREGILGDGLRFSKEEEAKAAAVNIKIDQFSGNFNTGDVNGDNGRINQGSVDNSVNSVGAAFDAAELERAIRSEIASGEEVKRLLEALEELKGAKRGGGALAAYQQFIAAAANHMTVVAPFLPALTAALGG